MTFLIDGKDKPSLRVNESLTVQKTLNTYFMLFVQIKRTRYNVLLVGGFTARPAASDGVQQGTNEL